MFLTYSQNFLLLNTITSSVYQKHRLTDLASFVWPFLIMLSKNHENKERSHEGGGTISTSWNSNDLTTKGAPKIHKNVINRKLQHMIYLVCIICFVPI